MRLSLTPFHAALFIALLAGACSPGVAPGKSDGAATGPAAIQRTLIIANRGESPSLAVRALVTQGSSLNIPPRFFNATLDILDVHEVSHPGLAEALPEFNTDSWKVF